MLTVDELKRYDRQLMIREIGEKGQERLKKAKVFIAGAGGLGSPAALYLTAAGIGAIRIVDSDKVDITNLNRQVLHWDEDIGKPKAVSAAEKLRRLNRNVAIEAIAERITEDNVFELLSDSDLIVDALDNLPARFILNKAALRKNIPFFHGAIYGLEGRVMTIIPGETACLKCVYRGAMPEKKFPVIGVTPALIGSVQAAEVIKYLLKTGELLTNRMLLYDALNLSFEELKIKKDPNCEHCGQAKP